MSPAQRRHLITDVPGPRSLALHERTNHAVSAGVGIGLPAYIAEAGGGVLVDVDGNHLIDFGSGIAVTTVGNADPRVVAAAREQLDKFTHTCFMVTPYEGYVEVCEQLNDLTPGEGAKRSALFNSGAEAIENAIKVARSATGRQAVVAFEHGYHGRTNLTMALTAKNLPYKDGFGPFAGEVYRAPMAYPLRWPGGAAACADEAFAALTTMINTQLGADRVAAVVLEPIQGEGGFIVPPSGWMAAVAEFCQQHGIVLIADEVQSGFCRTGDWFACDHEGVVPDLIVTAKGIAGGLPLAAVTGRAELMDAVHSGGLGGTYGGNPVACAAALGAFETMRADDLCSRAREIESVLMTRLRSWQQQFPQIADIRGRGAMIAFELTRGGVSDLTPLAAETTKINKACHAQGLVTLTAGTFGNVFRLLPPLAISDELLTEGLDILEDALTEVLLPGSSENPTHRS